MPGIAYVKLTLISIPRNIYIYTRLAKRVEEGICESSDEYAEEYDAHAAKVFGRTAALPVWALFRTALFGLAELTTTPTGRDILLG